MHAIVCQGNGKYYVSAVFGYFKNITATDEYEKYLQSIHNPYWIVWDEEKKRLIRWLEMVPNTRYIIPQILIVDSECDNWNMNDDGEGCVDFLSRALLDSFLDNEQQPEDILKKCRQMDDGYTYEEIQEIKDQKDIDDLNRASGGFHDARIAEKELQQDGTLYLKFDGTWGCEIEVWLWGGLEYDTSSRDSESCDPYWYGSTILKKDGFIYFIDEEDMTVEKIDKRYCFFKAEHMKYRIIPN